VKLLLIDDLSFFHASITIIGERSVKTINKEQYIT